MCIWIFETAFLTGTNIGINKTFPLLLSSQCDMSYYVHQSSLQLQLNKRQSHSFSSKFLTPKKNYTNVRNMWNNWNATGYYNSPTSPHFHNLPSSVHELKFKLGIKVECEKYPNQPSQDYNTELVYPSWPSRVFHTESIILNRPPRVYYPKLSWPYRVSLTELALPSWPYRDSLTELAIPNQSSLVYCLLIRNDLLKSIF